MASEYIDDFAAFIQASPSSYHAAAEVARQLEESGFARIDETDAWPTPEADLPQRGVLVRDGAVVAWAAPPNAGSTTPFRIVGAHTDSPGFKLKPKPTTGAAGWLQAGVEVYGGPLLNSWLDRELELAGRIVTTDGTEHLVRSGALLRIPQLAVHLDRGVNNEGLVLDKQRHTQPVWGVGDAEAADLLARVVEGSGAEASEIAGYDLVTVDTQEPHVFGLNGSLFASKRLDNLSSVYAGLRAMIAAGAGGAAPASDHISVLVAFDHEELGSESRSGANGPILHDVLTRISGSSGADGDQLQRAYAASWCVSADAGHAVHPNYPERHDPANRPIAGGGALLKINANQRYATDAHGAALWARLCAAAGVPYQEFVSNNSVPCGTTIGPLTATRLGIRTVDVGVPLLSMHSARELCHVDDPEFLAGALTAFYAGA
ncbi:M18 family aminopeptidase [Planctomonas sp. JC2975]|uniref:M18 family aminopeptidase n=1 Tax=Planctomonas sp. JC2975 TaxID=2729626 RepID=UPI0014740753|nr:M18 family aminopeptidase [Planctomonas sp. JC2975]NNC11431.1 M18 family aminopeptidase [Planctomonas sp. JC2975]